MKRKMNRIRIKICGITRPEDGVGAAMAGADAIGLVFYRPSPRHVDIEAASAIVDALPPFITRVGLFVDAPGEYIISVLKRIHLDMLQFHGDEPEADCTGYARPYIKAVRMDDSIELTDMVKRYSRAAGILLDAKVSGKAGGTGQSFDWGLIPAKPGKPVILAGGLNEANVLGAIQRVRPYAVDVSGGVESALGIKDMDKINRFIYQVRKYDNE